MKRKHEERVQFVATEEEQETLARIQENSGAPSMKRAVDEALVFYRYYLDVTKRHDMLGSIKEGKMVVVELLTFP